MKKLKSILVLGLCSVSLCANALNSVETASAAIGTITAGFIAHTLVNRGFALTDPRVATTISAISRSASTVAAGSGGTWAGSMAVLAPVAAVVAVGAGVKFYFANNGLAYLAPPGSTTSTPVFSNGLSPGGVCWSAGAGCFGSWQEALSYVFMLTTRTYPGAKYGVPTVTLNNATQYTAIYNYSIPELGLTNSSGSKIINAATSKVSCAAGSGFVEGQTGCIDAGLSASPWAGAKVVGYPLSDALKNLPADVQSAAVSPELIAELANREWQNAAAQAAYPGIPYSATMPVSAAAMDGFLASNPNVYWPTVRDLSTPVPAVPFPGVSNSNANNPATSASQVNLGVDPGIVSPKLEEAPHDIFKPVKEAMSNWTNWSVPAHSASCPRWQISPSIAGRIFYVDISYHCQIFEQYRALIAAAAMVGWLITAVFIILSA